MATHLVWFRQDLRITDNLALSAACAQSDNKVIALYIATPNQWQRHHLAPVQAGFIHANLTCLTQSLAVLGIPLLVVNADDVNAIVAAIKQVCRQHRIDALYINRQYPIDEQRRDNAVVQALSPSIPCHIYDDAVLFPPGKIINSSGDGYRVFTPFRHALIHQIKQDKLPVQPAPKPRGHAINVTPLTPFAYPTKPQTDFPAGEAQAQRRLRAFCREQVADYARFRDIPGNAGTSRLSPYLAVGVLSVRQCFHRLLLEQPDFLDQPQSGAFVWFSELVWREFYYHLVSAWPRLSMNQPFIRWTTAIAWNPGEADFKRWCAGETGFPIVDAAMRSLNQTGWMHNRLRMIVASFLVKDLLIDWRRGERYFMSHLIDGDFASNNGGWQWAASTGTDSVPYFRIFNPTTQGKRFDPDGAFIRRWLPELNAVPLKWLHTPHAWAAAQNVMLNYPMPMVSHAHVRIATLAAFEQAKRSFRAQ